MDEEFDIESLIKLAEGLAEQGIAPEDGMTPEELAALGAVKPNPTGRHYENLAQFVDDGELKKIARDVIQWVSWDEDSRADWRGLEAKGIRALGVSQNVDGGAKFKGASKAVHPALAEACVQFAARAIGNMWPAGGPVKTIVLGATNDEREDQARRVEQFLNYQYTELMPGAFEQVDQMMLRLPLSGSCFVKVYANEHDEVCRRYIEPADFIVPYRATDLETAHRYTEQLFLSQNELRKLQVSGYYRDVKLVVPREDNDDDRTEVTDEIDSSEGMEASSVHRDDDRHTLYECYCELDLPGFEDEKDGKPTGIALPYIVTVEKDSQEVLSITRNWKQADKRRKRVVHHIHYRFTPGLGFYGYGLYHWLGRASAATTGALRGLLDAAYRSNMQGGYRSSSARIEGGDQEIEPGVFKEVKATGDELSKAFFNLPFKEPSKTLFELMGAISQMIQRFAGTVDNLVGEGNANTPVGTTLARIEQGMKVTTAVQKRLHVAAGKEYKLVAWLNSIYLPQEYPYAVEGEDRSVFRTDFDSRVDVLPVSDPQYVSDTQRYFISKASMELAASAPQLYDLHALHKRAQASLRIENLDEILPDPDDMVKRRSPIEENAAAIQGLPLKAHLEQDHQAHLIVHQMFAQGLDAEMQKTVGPLLQAHMQEHMAMAYLLNMQAMTGVMFQMPGKDADDWQEVPVEAENQIAMLSAMAMQNAMAMTPNPDQQAQQAAQAQRDEEFQRDQARKDAVAAADIGRKNAQAEADINRKATQAMYDAIAQQQEPQAFQ